VTLSGGRTNCTQGVTETSCRNNGGSFFLGNVCTFINMGSTGCLPPGSTTTPAPTTTAGPTTTNTTGTPPVTTSTG
jgi:hypothetical protein